MPLTSNDVEAKFRDIAREASHLTELLSRWPSPSLDRDSQEAWEGAHICASATEKIYSGCERIMAIIVREIDGLAFTRSERWHSALLRRVAQTASGARSAIISEKCYLAIDRLRAFRHLERNTYGINLDIDIVVERSRDAISAFALFRAEVSHFLTLDPQSP
jgi:hypothetical protein